MKKLFKKIFKEAPPFIFTIVVAGAICWLTLAPKPLPESDIPLFPNADKVAHALMFGTLCAFLMVDLMRGNHHIRLAVAALVSILVSAAAGGAIELLQGAMHIGRSADIWDFVADSIGAVIAACLTAWFWARHCNGGNGNCNGQNNSRLRNNNRY